MAAPTPATKGIILAAAPGGIKLDDGYQSLIHFAGAPLFSLWEKSVTPPGLDGGEAIEATTMRNTTWRVFRPRALKSLTPMSVSGAYDPDTYDDFGDIINVEDTITVLFTDASTLAFYGYLQSVEYGELEEGTQPEVTLNIQPTNWDPDAKIEAGPLMTASVGT